MLETYSTFPLVQGQIPDDFCRPIAAVARRTETAGLHGLLIFSDNDSPDPWLTAQHLLERTTGLVPLVAVQPLYMHPYTAARMVTTLGAMYGRRVDRNLVAGGYLPHLRALGCSSGHDERYDRLLEYGEHLAALLGDSFSMTRRGEHYALDDAALTPRLPSGVEPRVFVAVVSPGHWTPSLFIRRMRLDGRHDAWKPVFAELLSADDDRITELAARYPTTADDRDGW